MHEHKFKRFNFFLTPTNDDEVEVFRNIQNFTEEEEETKTEPVDQRLVSKHKS